MQRPLFLGWQSWLAGFPLEFGEVCLRVAAEAGAQGSRLAPRFEPAAEVVPALSIDVAEVAGGGRVQPGRGGRDHPHLAAQDKGRGGHLAACGAPLVVAL
jgi:hypothetical protein